MKQDIIEIAFILDRSGSMSGLEKDTIGGFNSMLKKQQKESARATLTTVLFDDQYELLHDRLDISSISPITGNDYQVRGSTALIDAIGKTINKVENVQKSLSEKYRAKKVLFVIITDGMENSSREYTSNKIKSMIKMKKTKNNWEFIFLGANIDAVETARSFGISEDRAVDFHCDTAGIELNFEAVNEVLKNLRKGAPIAASWKENIDDDYRKRK